MLLKLSVCADNLNLNCWLPSVLLTLQRFSYAQRMSASEAAPSSNYSRHGLRDRVTSLKNVFKYLAVLANAKAHWLIYTDYFSRQTQATGEGVGLVCAPGDGQERIPEIRAHDSIKHTTVKGVLSLATAKKSMTQCGQKVSEEFN